MTTTIEPRAVATAAAASRTVTGLALPYGVPGHSSQGTVTVNAGAVAWPDDPKRVKLYRDHSDAAGSPVGYATSIEETAEGIQMSFYVGDTADGEAALADVREGIRDALSVEIMGSQIKGGELTAGTLTAVALVAVPAFEDARVSAFTASLSTEPVAPADKYEVIIIDDTATEDEGDEGDEGTADTENTEVTDPGDGDEPAAVDNGEHDETDTDTDKDEDMTQPLNTPADRDAATAPTGLVTASRKRAPIVTFSSVVDTLLATREARDRTELMTAALTDITRSAHPHVESPAWLGELWSGVAYTREIIPTMTSKPLTSMRATGWRWVTKPTVDDYAGDKADIPSNTPATEAVTLTASRLAGGHDIDRAYFDFNDREFIGSYFRAMAESYAMKSDDRAAAFIVAEAATNLGPAQSDLLRAAAKARQLVKTGTRTEATTYLVNPDDMFGLMDVTTLDNPAYLELLGINPAKFITSDFVPAGNVIAYAKPAVEFYELGSAPIRVEAEHLAQGGRDAALFGYYATFTTNPAGIVQVPFSGEGV